MSVRIGFIGAGGIARSHLANLLAMPEVEVVALCDISAEQVEATRQAVNKRLEGKAAQKLEAAAYTDYRAMFRQERLDGVYLCLPPFVHGDPEEAAIEAGVPMLVEKPVALELAVANRVLEGIGRQGLFAAVGYQLRYMPAMEKARQLLSGRTVGMALVMRFGATPQTSWYHRQSKSGGQLIEMATHQVDQLRYLLGEAQTVYAAAATRINHKQRPDYDIFDVNCMTLTFANGAVANFSNNFISAHGSPAEARGVHIFAEDMTLSIGRSFKVITAGGTEEIPSGADAMLLEDTAFVRAVAEGRPELLKSDYLSGVRTLAVTIAGDLSARTGKPVDVAQLLAGSAPYAATA
jgi:myo-inositol 2-dehydrogenase/D-chiro-inositol 1-dehydrogenase